MPLVFCVKKCALISTFLLYHLSLLVLKALCEATRRSPVFLFPKRLAFCQNSPRWCWCHKGFQKWHTKNHVLLTGHMTMWEMSISKKIRRLNFFQAWDKSPSETFSFHETIPSFAVCHFINAELLAGHWDAVCLSVCLAAQIALLSWVRTNERLHPCPLLFLRLPPLYASGHHQGSTASGSALEPALYTQPVMWELQGSAQLHQKPTSHWSVTSVSHSIQV